MKIDHIGIVCKDMESYIAGHKGVWEEFIVGNVIVNEVQKVKECFVKFEDDVSLEILEPLSDNSPISRFLAKGGGIHHICYLVNDIYLSVKRAKDNGALVVCKPVPDIAFEGKMIAFVMVGGELIEFVESKIS